MADRIMTLILQLIQGAGKTSTVLEDAFLVVGSLAAGTFSSESLVLEGGIRRRERRLVTADLSPRKANIGLYLSAAKVGNSGRHSSVLFPGTDNARRAPNL